MKQLNPRFCPTSLQDQAGWIDNLAIQFAKVATDLGFTNADVTALNNDNAAFQTFAAMSIQLKAYRMAVRQFRITILTASIDEPTPVFPDLPTYGVPQVVPAGMWERLDILIKRIRLSPKYNDEIAALLGILSASRPVPPPQDLQPTLKVEAMPGSSLTVSFKRYSTNGVVVQTKIDKAEDWGDAGRYYSSPINLVVPENPTGLPRAVQIRARYIDGNTPVGQFSPVVSASTQPES